VRSWCMIWRVATNDPMDAALLDWWLDGVTSDRVADILVERRIPFTFLTGYAQFAGERYREIPILKKPFMMEALDRAVSTMLANAGGRGSTN